MFAFTTTRRSAPASRVPPRTGSLQGRPQVGAWVAMRKVGAALFTLALVGGLACGSSGGRRAITTRTGPPPAGTAVATRASSTTTQPTQPTATMWSVAGSMPPAGCQAAYPASHYPPTAAPALQAMMLPTSALHDATALTPNFPTNGPDDLELAIAVQGQASAESLDQLPSYDVREVIGQYPSGQAAAAQYAHARQQLAGECGNADGFAAQPIQPDSLPGLGDDAMEWPSTGSSSRAGSTTATTVVIRKGPFLVALLFTESSPSASPPPAVTTPQVISISQLAVAHVAG